MVKGNKDNVTPKFLRELSNELKISLKDADLIKKSVVNSLVNSLKSSNNSIVYFKGLGSFSIIEQKGRKYPKKITRNDGTIDYQMLKSDDKKVLRFIASSSISDNF